MNFWPWSSWTKAHSGTACPQDLSGGQRQRVALARALAARPPILLLDEPFGALDPVTREAVAADVRDIHQALGLTTLMVTHDMTEALAAGRPHRGDARRPSGAGRHARANWWRTRPTISSPS